jgi:hypothetical protein
MPTGYRGLTIAFSEMFDELLANGRSQQQAAAELKGALINGALTLWDLHEPAWSDDQLLSAAFNVLKAFAARAQGIGAVPFLHAEYFKNVVAPRAQFDVVLGLAADPHSDPGTGRWSVPQIMAFAKDYFDTAENPAIKDFQDKIKAAGLKGNRVEVRNAYQRAFKEKFGATSGRGRRRLH